MFRRTPLKPAAPQVDGPRYVTAPRVPTLTVTVPASNTAPGYIFLTTFASPQAKPSHVLIVDERGELIYHKAEPSPISLLDFKRQPLGSMTYFSGSFGIGAPVGNYYEMNNAYEVTTTWKAGTPYLADSHDLQVLSNTRALLIVYDAQPRDLSAYGGLTNAQFVDGLIQQVDAQGNVSFSWRVTDHILVTDTYESLTTAVVDHSHINAVELDRDGNILISSRHLSEITKINRQTGQVMWRLGGKANQFTFVNDVGFSYQHDIRRLPNGHITLWDNGNQKAPPYSRAVEYEIDETNKVITRVWQYRDTPDVFNSFMGNVQVLPNNNRFLGWGGPRNLISEVDVAGNKRFEMTADASDGFIYRAFRFPWQGFPTITPTLVLTDAVAGVPRLYYSWNGATEIASYRVEAGKAAGRFTDALTQTKTGFENFTPLADLPADACFYRVMPLDKEGRDTRYSDVIYRGGDGCAPSVAIRHVPNAQLVLAGGTATVTVQVTNTGVTTLTNLMVTSTVPSVASCAHTGPVALASVNSALSYACVLTDVRSSLAITSRVDATTEGVAPTTQVSATDSAVIRVITPSLAISVTPATQSVPLLGTPTFTVTVRNTGDTAFSRLSVEAPAAPNCAFTLDGPLAPGGSLTYACARNAIIDTFTNTVTATGVIASGQSDGHLIAVNGAVEAVVSVSVRKVFVPLALRK